MRIFVIIQLLFLFACSSNLNNENNMDNSALDPELIVVQSDEGVNNDKLNEKDVFIDLLRVLKSSGLINDTIRFKKTYGGEMGYSQKINPYQEEEFTLFNIPLKETAPYYYKLREKAFDIDFENVENIRAYFFIDTNRSSNNRPDGIVEEWKTNNNESAKVLAEKLALEESKIYVNRGAYICYKENYIYIFHSRSVAFYDQLKIIHKNFADSIDAVIPNASKQRKDF